MVGVLVGGREGLPHYDPLPPLEHSPSPNRVSDARRAQRPAGRALLSPPGLPCLVPRCLPPTCCLPREEHCPGPPAILSDHKRIINTAVKNAQAVVVGELGVADQL